MWAVGGGQPAGSGCHSVIGVGVSQGVRWSRYSSSSSSRHCGLSLGHWQGSASPGPVLAPAAGTVGCHSVIGVAVWQGVRRSRSSSSSSSRHCVETRPAMAVARWSLCHQSSAIQYVLTNTASKNPNNVEFS
jgi:hypothetical protein